MWSSIVGALLGKIAPKVADFFMQKQQLKANIELEVLRGKAAYERSKTIRAENSEGRDHDWEMESIKNSGWKDEAVLIVMSIPMILSFIPFTTQYVVDGFIALDGTPLWYRTTVMTIYLATFGIRLWRRDMKKGTNVVEMLR